MGKIFINLKENSYYIHIDRGILTSISSFVEDTDKIMVISDENVNKHYGDLVLNILVEKQVNNFIIQAGEDSKNFSKLEEILNNMIEVGLDRNSKIIALGGGVVGDIAGFAASIYMRGIPYIQIPTSLLAQVDSSVGGKTAINMSQGKNMVGSFYQPEAVIIDINTLKTLPKREIISGIGEIIKYGIIWDYTFLDFIEEKLEAILELEEKTMKFVIKKCCEIKGEIVSQDEKESGIRKILNFGHTIGHALEVVTDYKRYSHGEAVLIGMFYETIMANRLGYMDNKYCEKIQRLIKRTEINLEISEFPIESLVRAMGKDKKNKGKKVSFIFPKEEGSVEEVFLEKGEIYW